jgi:hypothetical protein
VLSWSAASIESKLSSKLKEIYLEKDTKLYRIGKAREESKNLFCFGLIVN